MNSSKRIAFVTGANKGIGFEVARRLGIAGMTVLLGARDAGLGQAAAAKLKAEDLGARFVALDLLVPATIEAAAARIATDFQRLDVLVNNAGINAPGDAPPSVVDLGVVRRVMDTNFFGTLAVTQAMLPLLRKATGARIVNVSSGLGSLTWNADPELGIRAVQAARIQRLQDRDEHADRPTRLRIARDRNQGELLGPRLHRDRP